MPRYKGFNSATLLLGAFLALSTMEVFFAVSMQTIVSYKTYSFICASFFLFFLSFLLWFTPSTREKELNSWDSSKLVPGVESIPAQIDLFLVLRGIACLLVVLMHSGIVLGRNFTKHGSILSALTYSPAWLGMGIFFSLSGYLMTLSFKNKKYSIDRSGIRRFLQKRFFRIGPLTLIAFLVVAMIEKSTQKFNFFALLQVLTFGYYGKGGAAGTGALWSMSTEWIFYCTLPLFLLFRFGRSARYYILLGLFVEAFLITSRYEIYSAANGMGGWHYLYFSLLGNSDFFVGGILAALIKRPVTHNKPIGVFYLLATLTYLIYTFCAFPAMAEGKVEWQSRFVIFLPGVTSVLIYSIIRFCAGFNRKLGTASNSLLTPLEYLGRISLPLYLIHSELFIIFRRNFSSWGYLKSFCCVFPLAIILAHLLSITIEAYFIKKGARGFRPNG